MSKRVPTVSVILPTYNRAHLLGRAIQSVLSQTYQDFEIVVVDDGSTDNTQEVVNSFDDERIRYIRHEKNMGAAAARNTGIKAARGEYIAFQDSDDEWLPSKLEKQMEMFETAPPEVGVVYTGCYRCVGAKKTYMPSPEITQKEGHIFPRIFKGSFVELPTVLVRRECFERAGMLDERLPRLVDWELFIRISEYYHFRYINEPLVISYLQPDSISANEAALITALELILERHFEKLRKDRSALAGHYLAIGHHLCSQGRLKQGRSYFKKAVEAYPLSVKAQVAVLASLLGQRAYNRAATSYLKTKGGMAKQKHVPPDSPSYP